MKRRAGSKTVHSRKSRSGEPKAARASSSPAKTSDSSQASEELRPRIGLESALEKIVPHNWTIASYDPRLPAVLSTPAMIGMMEIAAAQAVLAELPPGAITVGTRIEVDHLKAVPEGTAVRARARLVKHKGRFLVFEVEAKAGEHLIGRGHVYRAIVQPHSFRAKADSRTS